MIWGIEGIHAWTPPGAEAAAIELGRIKSDAGVPVWPRYTLRTVSGLMGLGDAEDNRDAPVGRIGELARLSYRRGKTVAYEGAIKARTLIELREAEETLRAAFAEETTEGRMDVSPHPLDTQWKGVPAKFYEARPLTLEIVDVQESPWWERLYVVSLRLSDPRYFDEESEKHTLTLTDTNTTYTFT